VARALLGDAASLSAAERVAADRNGNGVLDVGDLRAAVRGAAEEPMFVLALGPKGPGGGGGGAADAVNAGTNVSLVLVLTGSLQNGTPIMGEDPITIKFNGSGL
jgi:hypothetical protein